MRFILLLSCLAFAYFPAPAQDSLLIQTIEKSTYSVNWEQGKLTGPGFQFLKEKAENSSFFLIGEHHGIAEIAQFTASLFQQLKPSGYKYFATETGPYTAQLLQQMALQDNWEQNFEALFQQYPWSIPFFSLREESSILQSVLAGHQGEEQLIWGLDQEFAACFRLFFDHLYKNAKTENSKKVAKTYYELAENSFRESSETKNPGKSFLGIAQAKDFTALKEAFQQESENLQLIEELEKSVEIYQLWFKGQGFKSNSDRAAMMKRHFMTYYRAVQQSNPTAKVMVKLGANHLYRGTNPLQVYDIGNFISELANQQQSQSFHLYVMGCKGTNNAYTPFSQSEADKTATYDALKDFKKVNFAPLIHATGEQGWSLVDLRPLKEKIWAKSIKDVHPGLYKLIWSYDAILVIPEVHASTFFE